MEEEFQESEVMFAEFSSGDERFKDEASSYYKDDNRRSKKQGSSEPVAIPESNTRLLENGGDEEFHMNEDDEEMIPPHVLMAKRMESKMACSVYARSGRVLKGKNLCQVRNSILRMTGFLES